MVAPRSRSRSDHASSSEMGCCCLGCLTSRATYGPRTRKSRTSYLRRIPPMATASGVCCTIWAYYYYTRPILPRSVQCDCFRRAIGAAHIGGVDPTRQGWVVNGPRRTAQSQPIFAFQLSRCRRTTVATIQPLSAHHAAGSPKSARSSMVALQMFSRIRSGRFFNFYILRGRLPPNGGNAGPFTPRMTRSFFMSFVQIRKNSTSRPLGRHSIQRLDPRFGTRRRKVRPALRSRVAAISSMSQQAGWDGWYIEWARKRKLGFMKRLFFSTSAANWAAGLMLSAFFLVDRVFPILQMVLPVAQCRDAINGRGRPLSRKRLVHYAEWMIRLGAVWMGGRARDGLSAP